MKQSLLFCQQIPLSNTISLAKKFRISTLLFLFFLTCQLTYGGDIIGKLIVGYQGWFNCKGDGSPINSWVHWGGSNGPSPGFGNLHFDLYPDVREFTNTYQTGLGNLNNGQPAKLFSSYDAQVVNKHVEWMQQYGIDVAALQRFASGVTPGSTKKAHKDGIATKLKNACQTYDRKFYIMYDLSDMAMDTSFIDILRRDWTNTITSASALNLLASPAYAKEMVDGVMKPVVCIWGFGSSGRPGDVNSYTTLVNWFKNTAGCYVIIGGTNDWLANKTLLPAFKLANMISPWLVGRFGDEAGANSYADGRMKDDFAYCNANGIDYMPVVFPGFTWANWKVGYENKRNDKPRMHGNFMWRQFYNVKSKGIPNVYVAMFDEFDEGTAIAKAAENASMIPNNQWFLTLDADGVACSSDFYLRLVGDAAKMMKGIIPITSEHPTSHTQSLTPGIVITPAAASLNIGNTLQLNATEYPVNESNKPLFFLSSNEAVATVNSTGLITAIAEGTASIIAKTQDGSKISTCVITVITNTVSAYFDDCDAVNGWISTATLNNTHQKQGIGCLENISANSTEFSKTFITPFSSNAIVENGQLKLWYWVSLAELGARTVRVEIGSAGRADVDEYQWSMTGLVDGWNQISLNTINASKLGNPDLNAINWFRIYSTGKTVGSNVTTRVDAIELGSSIESAIKTTNANQKSINIYPNPLTKSTLSIDMAGFSGMKNVQLKIVNLLGQIVYRNKVENTDKLEINTSEILKESIYFVTVETDHSKITQKLIVANI